MFLGCREVRISSLNLEAALRIRRSLAGSDAAWREKPYAVIARFNRDTTVAPADNGCVIIASAASNSVPDHSLNGGFHEPFTQDCRHCCRRFNCVGAGGAFSYPGESVPADHRAKGFRCTRAEGGGRQSKPVTF